MVWKKLYRATLNVLSTLQSCCFSKGVGVGGLKKGLSYTSLLHLLQVLLLAPTPAVKWLHYTHQWCTLEGRVKLGQGVTASQCKEMCKEGCLGVEWWQAFTMSCYECTDPARKEPFTDENDNSYPPHVFLKSNGEMNTSV